MGQDPVYFVTVKPFVLRLECLYLKRLVLGRVELTQSWVILNLVLKVPSPDFVKILERTVDPVFIKEIMGLIKYLIFQNTGVKTPSLIGLWESQMWLWVVLWRDKGPVSRSDTTVTEIINPYWYSDQRLITLRSCSYPTRIFLEDFY